jgi:D-glycero-D-manno-heptose 1,7-bisphosphate phosphatase
MLDGGQKRQSSLQGSQPSNLPTFQPSNRVLKAVFLDRDGVINADRDDYVKNTAELRVYPFAPAAIRRLNDAGWTVFVVSNQQGVAKGVIAESDLLAIEREIERRVEEAGGRISGFYYCRHLASDNCSCRKPEPGLILRAAQSHGIDLSASVLVGDSERDIVAGNSAGCKTVLVLTGKFDRDSAERLSSKPDFVANDLGDAAVYIESIGRT